MLALASWREKYEVAVVRRSLVVALECDGTLTLVVCMSLC